nr:unnamed protein product [Spirometra erinaceieuropaei]
MHLLILVLIVYLARPTQQVASCQGLGEACSRTIFQRCCGNTVCDLKWFGHGSCVKCYEPRRLCLWDDECCSKNCKWFFCQ